MEAGPPNPRPTRCVHTPGAGARPTAMRETRRAANTGRALRWPPRRSGGALPPAPRRRGPGAGRPAASTSPDEGASMVPSANAACHMPFTSAVRRARPKRPTSRSRYPRSRDSTLASGTGAGARAGGSSPQRDRRCSATSVRSSLVRASSEYASSSTSMAASRGSIGPGSSPAASSPSARVTAAHTRSRRRRRPRRYVRAAHASTRTTATNRAPDSRSRESAAIRSHSAPRTEPRSVTPPYQIADASAIGTRVERRRSRSRRRAAPPPGCPAGTGR